MLHQPAAAFIWVYLVWLPALSQAFPPRADDASGLVRLQPRPSVISRWRVKNEGRRGFCRRPHLTDHRANANGGAGAFPEPAGESCDEMQR